MSSVKRLALLNTLGFVIVVVLNYLAVALPINGYTTGELSALYPNYFVPAGFTFSIWGLIYTLLLAFIIYQIWSAWKGTPADQAVITQIGPWFFVSCLANASWIVVWHYLQVPLSFAIMLTILSSLITVYQHLGIGESAPANGRVRWLAHLPISVYLGWITVATIANVTILLVSFGWDGGPISEIKWAGLMVGIAAMIGLLILWFRRDVAYVMVLIWAFFGIYSKQNASGMENVRPIILTTVIAMAVLSAQVIRKVLQDIITSRKAAG